MTQLKAGDRCPAFQGMTENGPITLRDLKGKTFVLYFYPKDATPGCTQEACDFRDAFPAFKKLGVPVFGVSRDPLAAHQKFSAAHALPFTLISDEDGSLCESLGVWVEKSLYGRKYKGIERTTYLVDEDGKIKNVWKKVKVKGHVDDVLMFIKNK